MGDGDVVILENTRFHAVERKNDEELATGMASLAQVRVNDAFVSAHRARFSIGGVTNCLLSSISGFRFAQRPEYLQGAGDSQANPMAAIVGRANVSMTNVVTVLTLDKVDKLVIGGDMVLLFLISRGLAVGSSIVVEEYVELANKLEEEAKNKIMEIIFSDRHCEQFFFIAIHQVSDRLGSKGA